jgi:hypothetical protein
MDKYVDRFHFWGLWNSTARTWNSLRDFKKIIEVLSPSSFLISEHLHTTLSLIAHRSALCISFDYQEELRIIIPKWRTIQSFLAHPTYSHFHLRPQLLSHSLACRYKICTTDAFSPIGMDRARKEKGKTSIAAH